MLIVKSSIDPYLADSYQSKTLHQLRALLTLIWVRAHPSHWMIRLCLWCASRPFCLNQYTAFLIFSGISFFRPCSENKIFHFPFSSHLFFRLPLFLLLTDVEIFPKSWRTKSSSKRFDAILEAPRLSSSTNVERQIALCAGGTVW